jgi:hypothetical protein
MKKKQQEHLQHLLATNIEATPPQPVIEPKPIARMNLEELVNKTALTNNELKERIDNLKLKSLNKEKSSPTTISTTTSQNTPSIVNNTSIRPKIFVSKQTNKKLQQIAIDKFETNVTLNNILSNTTTSTSEQTTSSSITSSNEKIRNSIIKDLVDMVDNLTKDFPYVHLTQSDNLKDFSSNKIYFNNLNEFVNNHRQTEDGQSTSSVKIANYESPLLMFKGYRFSKTFCELNSFETAYSKFYCNSIDIRKPFCPFDLNGSCKDSNCV